MRPLPTLVRGSHSVRLPFCNRSAELLARALVCGAAEERHNLCLTAVNEDAGLALWCLCQAGDGVQLRRPSDIADWLRASALGELRWNSAEDFATSAFGDSERRQFAQLAASASTTARLAAALADRHEGVDAQTAYLLGFVHAAREWLAVAGGESTVREAQLLPAWLASELTAIDRARVADTKCATAGSSSSAAGEKILLGKPAVAPESNIAPGARVPDRLTTLADIVKQARELLAPKNRRKLPAPCDRQQFAAQRKATLVHWLQDADEPFFLPRLVEKLARLQQLETQFEQTLEREKIESLKELAYGAGHEINNPLANISARAQTLLVDERDPERRRKLAAINAQAFRAHEMIADMMLFARPPQPTLERVDLAVFLQTLLDELRERAASQGTTLSFYEAADAVVWADPVQLAVAVRALCTNSLEALSRGGIVEITLRTPTAAQNAGQFDHVQLVVEDNGPGVPAEVRRHLFDPFYSGREAGRGLGFGLSKCWRIVTDHGGRIEVDSSPGGGARFTLTLPQFAETAPPLAESAKVTSGTAIGSGPARRVQA